MKRFFELISKEQFEKDFAMFDCSYEDLKIPVRKTKNSAGYDFYLPFDLTLRPNEIFRIPTGIKVSMYHDELLYMYIRSSIGFKYNIRFCNQVGVIDSDYYNNADNEGNIWIALQNHSNEIYNFKKGERLFQGVFQKYLVVENDDATYDLRVGGLGSTSNKEDK